MRKFTKILVIGAVVVAAAGVGAVAMAETAGPGFGPPFMHGRMGPGMMGGMGPGMMGGMMGARGGPQAAGFADPASHLAALKTELGIKPEQTAAWDAYAKVVQEIATQMRTARGSIDRDAVAKMSPEERSAFIAKRFELHDKAFGAVKTAAQTLLPSLDDTQKTRAQAELPGLTERGPGGAQHAGMPMMGHGMGMMRGPMGGFTR